MDPNAVWKCLCEALKDLGKCPNNEDTRAHVCGLPQCTVHVGFTQADFPRH